MTQRWTGIGNLTDDPEMRYTPGGDAVTSFSIAINNGKDREGNERPPDYIDIVAWEKLGENVAEYCKKGSKVYVEGPLKVDKWEDKESGAKRKRYYVRAFTVEFLTPRSRDDDDDRPARRPNRDERPARRAPRDDLDDLPF